MENIIVVETDPIVWLDLSDALKSRFRAAQLERLPLEDAIASVATLCGSSRALITAILPENLSSLASRCAEGLRLVVTNTFADVDVRAALPSALFIERPFDAGEILDFLAPVPS